MTAYYPIGQRVWDVYGNANTVFTLGLDLWGLLYHYEAPKVTTSHPRVVEAVEFIRDHYQQYNPHLVLRYRVPTTGEAMRFAVIEIRIHERERELSRMQDVPCPGPRPRAGDDVAGVVGNRERDGVCDVTDRRDSAKDVVKCRLETHAMFTVNPTAPKAGDLRVGWTGDGRSLGSERQTASFRRLRIGDAITRESSLRTSSAPDRHPDRHRDVLRKDVQPPISGDD